MFEKLFSSLTISESSESDEEIINVIYENIATKIIPEARVPNLIENVKFINTTIKNCEKIFGIYIELIY